MDCSTCDEIQLSRASPTLKIPAFQRPTGEWTWVTASGLQLSHTVYSLVGCPAPQAGLYLLVERTGHKNVLVLAIGRTLSRHASINLARIRKEGAKLGANEVHLYPIASASERIRLHVDLAAAVSGSARPVK